MNCDSLSWYERGPRKLPIDSLAAGLAGGPVSISHAIILEVVLANAQRQGQSQLFSRGCFVIKVADCHLRLRFETLLLSGFFSSAGEFSLHAPTVTSTSHHSGKQKSHRVRHTGRGGKPNSDKYVVINAKYLRPMRSITDQRVHTKSHSCETETVANSIVHRDKPERKSESSQNTNSKTGKQLQ